MKTKFPLGACKNQPDLRRVKLAQFQQVLPAPAQLWTDTTMIPGFNQKRLGACVGHAHSFIHIYQNYVETGKLAKLSPRYLYSLAKKIDGYAGEGTFPAIVAKISNNKGCATETTVLNDTTLPHASYINILETEAVVKDAYPYRIGGYADCPTSAAGLKSALFQNKLLAITISIGNYKSPLKKGSDGYHRVVLVGYGYEGLKIVNGVVTPYGVNPGRYFIKNSWDDTWGVKGYGWFDLKDQELMDIEAYVDIPNEILEANKQLPTVKLIRQNSDSKQTLGDAIATYNDKTFTFKTLEKPWLNNAVNVSCIPAGSYVCKLEYSKKYKAEVYRLYNVKGRSSILIHPGNYYKDTMGCILPGVAHIDINKDGEKDVTASRNTLTKLITFFEKKDFTLIIKNNASLEISEAFVETYMTSYKTWGGIILAVLGAIGITDKLGYDNLAGIVDSALAAVGFVLAAISTFKTQKEVVQLRKVVATMKRK